MACPLKYIQKLITFFHTHHCHPDPSNEPAHLHYPNTFLALFSYILVATQANLYFFKVTQIMLFFFSFFLCFSNILNFFFFLVFWMLSFKPTFFIFYFFYLWWILSYIEMKQPWVYMCSPYQSPLPTPSPLVPSRFSQCTRSERLSHASNLGWWSVSP